MAVGKTIVSSSMIDRVAAGLNRRLIEVPVGFKWFVEGLIDGTIGFCGEESSGATFLRRDGTVWTTDKDGIVPNLLAAEITARTGRDPGEHYRKLTAEFGDPLYERLDAVLSQNHFEDVRRRTTSCWRRTRFSASSRARRAKRDRITSSNWVRNATIGRFLTTHPPVRHPDKVFGRHRLETGDRPKFRYDCPRVMTMRTSTVSNRAIDGV